MLSCFTICSPLHRVPKDTIRFQLKDGQLNIVCLLVSPSSHFINRRYGLNPILFRCLRNIQRPNNNPTTFPFNDLFSLRASSALSLEGQLNILLGCVLPSNDLIEVNFCVYHQKYTRITTPGIISEL